MAKNGKVVYATSACGFSKIPPAGALEKPKRRKINTPASSYAKCIV
jgi:hypothetical protein